MFKNILKENNVISIWGPSGSGKSISLNELYLIFKKESCFLNNLNNIKNVYNKKKIKYVFIDDALVYLKTEEKKKIIDKLLENGKKIIFTTSNPEELLFSDYIYILNNCEIVIEGPLVEVLRNEKIIKNLGLKNPFIVDLSIQLIHYELIDKVYLNDEELIDSLWK